MYFNNPKQINISNLTMFNNSVSNYSLFTKSGLGGAIYYTCGLSYNCNINMLGYNYFGHNRADNAGGAIKWDDLEPNLY
jgi:hypothetical protein